LATSLTESAPAKVNLTLRVVGRRADGYHDIESLVAFADVGDVLAFAPADALDLSVRGPNAASAGPGADNLVLKAARALAAVIPGLALGRFVLTKRLPVAAGLGGGSADAAAALRLLALANDLAQGDPRLMRGVGDVLSAPLDLPRLAAVLVNPGVALATRDVFDELGLEKGARHSQANCTHLDADVYTVDALLSALSMQTNDLETPAISLRPVIADVLAALRAAAGCRIARMSGSGATCFGLFDSARAATAAARHMRGAHSGWWIRATMLSSSFGA